MKLSCPVCHRHTVKSGRGCLVWAVVVLIFPIGLLALLASARHRCTTCGHGWKA